jgi:hypothetical protein
MSGKFWVISFEFTRRIVRNGVTWKLLLLSPFTIKLLIEEVFDMMIRLRENEEEWREAVLPENCYFCHLFKFWVYKLASLQEKEWCEAMLPANCYFCHLFKFWVYESSNKLVNLKSSTLKNCYFCHLFELWVVNHGFWVMSSSKLVNLNSWNLVNYLLLLPENCYFCHFFKFWVYKRASLQEF